MIVLALAAFTISASAIAAESSPLEKPFRVAVFCTKSGEQTSGLTKVCYYNCVKSEGALTVKTYEACPGWTPRWRLNRAGHFGPNPRQLMNR
jgi:hypothetical protein